MLLNANLDEEVSIHRPRLVMGAQHNTLDGILTVTADGSDSGQFISGTPPFVPFVNSVPIFLARRLSSTMVWLNFLHPPEQCQHFLDCGQMLRTVFVLSVNGAKRNSSWFVSFWILQCSENNTTSIQAVLQILNLDLFLREETRSQDTGQRQQVWLLVNHMLPRLNSDTLLGNVILRCVIFVYAAFV